MWFFNNQEIISIPPCTGFVYCITNLTNNKKYIGKKLSHFTKTITKKVTLKSGIKKSKKVKVLVESDWQSYWGSCQRLLSDIESIGVDNFSREIIVFCYSKSELSYMEAKHQFDNNVLLSDDWYNGIISCRINKKHLTLLKVIK